MTKDKKFKVCPECKGKGTVDNYGAFTSDHLDEWYGDGYERDEFLEDYKKGVYDVSCDVCKGLRVVTKKDIKRAQDLAEMNREMAAEMRYSGSF